MIQRFLRVCLHHFVKICMISILPLVSYQKKFKLVYILNLDSRDKEVNPKPLLFTQEKPLWEDSEDFCFEAALREPYPVGKQL